MIPPASMSRAPWPGESASTNERALVERAKNGDQTAWRALYEDHRRYVFTLLRRILDNTELAEDLAQETWVLIFRKLGQFEYRSPFKSWAARVATNVALQAVRGLQPTFVELPDLPDLRTGAPADFIVDRLALTRALAELSPGHRAVIELRREGFTYDEIAGALDIKSATARSQYHRALAYLFQRFTSPSGEPRPTPANSKPR